MVAVGRLGVDRATVERLVDDRVPMGTDHPRGHLPFTKLSKKRSSWRCAGVAAGTQLHRVRAHRLALARVGRDGVAEQILADLGVTSERLERAIRERAARHGRSPAHQTDRASDAT